MTRYYRAILTAGLLGAAAPAFAQTPAPAAPVQAPATETAAPAPDAAPAATPDSMAPKATKPATHKHHHVTKHKTASKDTTPPADAQNK